MILKIGKVEKGLKQKGFEKDNRHHKYFYYVTTKNVWTTIKTRVSHKSSGTDIGKGLIGEMAKQCKISKENFIKLIDCTLSQTEYERLLYSKNILNKEDIRKI